MQRSTLVNLEKGLILVALRYKKKKKIAPVIFLSEIKCGIFVATHIECDSTCGKALAFNIIQHQLLSNSNVVQHTTTIHEQVMQLASEAACGNHLLSAQL